MLEVIQYPLFDAEVFERFIAEGGHNFEEYAKVEIEENKMPLAMKKEIIIVDGKITFGSNREVPKLEEPNLDSNLSILKDIEALKVFNHTPSQIYDSLDKASIPVEELKAARIVKLKEECSNAIYEGFTSQGFSFGFNESDQANFTQQLILVVAGQTENIPWKTKNASIQIFTPEQFKQVVIDAKNHKLENQEKYWSLEAEVHVAFTNKEVDVIRW